MVKWSIALGVLGMIGTGSWAVNTSHKFPHWGLRQYWFIGLAALAPAWLVAFVGLLPTVAGDADLVPLPPVAILSSSAALFGIIVTDYALRRLHRSGHIFSKVVYWLFGLIALLPAWCIALVNLP